MYEKHERASPVQPGANNDSVKGSLFANNLLKIICTDEKSQLSLIAYADTIVRNKNNNIVAIRFGGYPEQVVAISDCINSGCQLTIKLDHKNLDLKSEKPNGYYRKISHDGLYAESIMYIKDDEQRSLSISYDSGEEKELSINRNLYIFCEDESLDSLYLELDRKLSVPLIPEFRDYFLRELQARNILSKLKVWSQKHFSAYHIEVTDTEKELGEILEDGLKTGQIRIPEVNISQNAALPYTVDNSEELNKNFSSIKSFSQYLNAFGNDMARKIKSSFSPLYEPESEEICTTLKNADNYIFEHTGYNLFPAQLAAAEAAKRVLNKDNIAFIVAECGSGKTKIGACTLFAHQQKKSFNVVICPSHLCDKWVREIDESLPNTAAFIINNIHDADKAYGAFKYGNKTIYCVISKESARDGYMKMPAVKWSKARGVYRCPDCGKVIETDLFDGYAKYRIPADQFFFLRETSKNHKCDNCGSLLWTCLNPNILSPQKTEWVKIGNYGFVHRRFAKRHLEKVKDTNVLKSIQQIVDNPDGIFPARGAHRRYSLSMYFKRKIKHVDGLIIDELHKYSGESGQGEAMAELAGISNKVVTMTATLANGYVKGMFYLLYRLKSQLMRMDKKSFKDLRLFCEEYGVVEKVYDVHQSKYNSNSRAKKRLKREKFLPGISPFIYSRFLINNTVFLTLKDISDFLPEYEEIPVGIEPSEDILCEYNSIEKKLKTIIRNDKTIGQKLLAKYLNMLLAYPEQPYAHEPICHPLTGDILVAPESIGDINSLQPKDIKLLGLVENKIKGGEKVIVYTSWTRLDTQEKLLKLFLERGIRAKILNVRITARKREQWIEKQLSEGIDVLITNPTLVETGLDLNAFTTLIFYNVAFDLYVFRQASRRSWRINQKYYRIEVYVFYYVNTIQQRSIRLMASKLEAAATIEGHISDEGLSALSDCQDMTTALAKELTLGIKQETDFVEKFKKMAFLKPSEEKAEEIESVKRSEVVTSLQPIPSQQITSKQLQQRLRTRKKVQYISEDQMSLFDLLAS